MLALADLAYFTATGVAIYTLPLYVTGPVGSDKAGAGLAFGAFAISALLLRPLVGRLCDTLGRAPLLVGGALLAGVALALTASVESLTLVIALRLVLGVAEAAFFVASLAALADLAPPERMGEAVSYNSLGLYLGLAFGPPLGEVLTETWSFDVAWYGAAVLGLVAAVVVLGIGETREAGSMEVGHAMIHRKAIPAALAFFASLMAVGGFLSLGALHAHDVGLANASIPLFAYGLVVVACRVAFAKVPDRLPPLLLGRRRPHGDRGRAPGHRHLDHADRHGGRLGGAGAGRHFQHPGVLLRDLRHGATVRAGCGLRDREPLHRPGAGWWPDPARRGRPGLRHPRRIRDRRRCRHGGRFVGPPSGQAAWNVISMSGSAVDSGHQVAQVDGKPIWWATRG